MKKGSKPDDGRTAGKSPARTSVWAALSITITAASLAVVARFVSPAEILALLERADRGGLALGFLLFAFANVMKSERLRLLTEGGRRTDRLAHCALVWIYNLVSSALPGGLGEVSYPAMLRLRRGTSLTAGLSAVVVTRTLDIAAVGAACAAAAWVPFARTIPGLAWIVVCVPGLVFGGLLLIPPARRALGAPGSWRRFTSRVRADAGAQPAQVLGAAWKARGLIASLTLAIWLPAYLGAWVVSRSLRLPLDLAQVVAGNSLAMLMSVLPFKGVLGFGTQHAGWVAALALFGWSSSAALEVAIPMHLAGVAFTVVLGGAGWALAMIRRAGVRGEGER